MTPVINKKLDYLIIYKYYSKEDFYFSSGVAKCFWMLHNLGLKYTVLDLLVEFLHTAVAVFIPPPQVAEHGVKSSIGIHTPVQVCST